MECESSDYQPNSLLKTTAESDDSDFGDCDISEPFDPDREQECLGEEDSDEDDGDERPRWTSGRFAPVVHDFDPSESGLKLNVNDGITESECFKLFLDSEVMQFIVEETNRQQEYATKDVKEYDRTTWKATNTDEIYIFLSVLMLMTQNTDILSLMFGPEDAEEEEMPTIADTMELKRFSALLDFLHFNDNTNQLPGDRIFKVRHILKYFKNKFSQYFQPHQNVYIDESLDLFDLPRFSPRDVGRTPPRYILNLLLLRDCKTDFIVNYDLNSSLYISAKEDSARFVIPLLEPYFERGHTLYCNNKFTTPKLFDQLHQRKTNACGVIRKRLKNVPRLVKNVAEQLSTNTMMLKMCGRNGTNILTTLHPGDEGESPAPCLVDYRKNDLSIKEGHYYGEKMISTLPCLRRSKMKWYKMVFFNLVDLCLVNAHIIYRNKYKKKVNFRKFQAEVAKQLIALHKTPENS